MVVCDMDQDNHHHSETLFLTIGDIDSTESTFDLTKDNVLVFTTQSELFEFVNSETMEILGVLSDVDSIRGCARLLNRGAKSVHEELVELEELGIVRLEERELGARPIFRYDRIVVEIPLSHE